MGFSVFIDDRLAAGASFGRELDRQAREAKAIFALGSIDAFQSSFTAGEWRIGLRENKLACAQIRAFDYPDIPVEFSGQTFIDIQDFDGQSRHHVGWNTILLTLATLSDKTALVQAASHRLQSAKTRELLMREVQLQSNDLITETENISKPPNELKAPVLTGSTAESEDRRNSSSLALTKLGWSALAIALTALLGSLAFSLLYPKPLEAEARELVEECKVADSNFKNERCKHRQQMNPKMGLRKNRRTAQMIKHDMSSMFCEMLDPDNADREKTEVNSWNAQKPSCELVTLYYQVHYVIQLNIDESLKKKSAEKEFDDAFDQYKNKFDGELEYWNFYKVEKDEELYYNLGLWTKHVIPDRKNEREIDIGKEFIEFCRTHGVADESPDPEIKSLKLCMFLYYTTQEKYYAKNPN